MSSNFLFRGLVSTGLGVSTRGLVVTGRSFIYNEIKYLHANILFNRYEVVAIVN
jgi:hypothetical protein